MLDAFSKSARPFTKTVKNSRNNNIDFYVEHKTGRMPMNIHKVYYKQ